MFVDHGLLRSGEAEQVEKDFVAATGVDLKVVDAAGAFLGALAGVADPGAEAKDHRPRVHPGVRAGRAGDQRASSDAATFLVQGTLYPDVVESGGGTGAANIKSHHNVGGLPDDLKFELVEPLRDLFKDEVRQVGAELGLPDEIVWRQPFPGPGLAIRIVGEVTADRLGSCRPRTRSLALNCPRRAWTGRSGNARWCCWPTSGRSAFRETAAATATRSCSGR